MEIDVLLIIVASIWTILMFILQFGYITRPLVGLPYEITSKMLMIAAHALLLAAIWISALKISVLVNWILIAISFMVLGVWFIFSKIQDNYMFEKISSNYQKLFEEAGLWKEDLK